jgi:hypothetical protein
MGDNLSEFVIKSLNEISERTGIPFLIANDPYSTSTVNKIREKGLDVLLFISGFGIIKELLLNSKPLGILSYHHGDVRRYRGQPSAFW